MPVICTKAYWKCVSYSSRFFLLIIFYQIKQYRCGRDGQRSAFFADAIVMLGLLHLMPSRIMSSCEAEVCTVFRSKNLKEQTFPEW